ncbi:MAG: tRNA pseudouridine(13) synthase TruD [Armatimonadetes bacterium]|nr:tRNA pseudouridine(13) synthase TruD [Armatimonadota bacterium]
MYVSQPLPGVGGRLKAEPEDFELREVPAYEPAGEGPHRYFEITKRDRTTREVVEELAGALGIPPGDIGYAGLKDRRALATQRISLPAAAAGPEAGLEKVSGVLAYRSLGCHHNKLRRGHLLGNRFRIRIRDVVAAAPERARAIQESLSRTGWPNFFGQQRFGRAADNAAAGREVLRTGRLRGPRWKRDLLLSAFQSELFNRVLKERIRRGDFLQILPGDLCARLPAGGMFAVESPQAELPRLKAFEISPTGPIFGYKMRCPQDAAWELERQVLEEEGLSLDSFRPARLPGSRRRLRLPLEEFQWEAQGSDLLVSFFLPGGSYATVLLEEFMKVGGSAPFAGGGPAISEADVDDLGS